MHNTAQYNLANLFSYLVDFERKQWKYIQDGLQYRPLNYLISCGTISSQCALESRSLYCMIERMATVSLVGRLVEMDVSPFHASL